MIAVKFRGLRQLQARFGKFPKEFRDIIGEAVLDGAEAVAASVRKEAPVKTGELREAISIRYRYPDEAWIFIAEPAHTYALYLERGTRPHLIKPISAKALRIDVNGIVFAKYARHPGTSPNPFMRRGYQEAEDKVNQIFEKATEKAVRTLEI